MEKNLFYCASKDQTYEGYTKVGVIGKYPLFDKYTSEKVFNDLVKMSPDTYKWFFNGLNDTFVFITNNEECELFKGCDYEINGEIEHLYLIGDEWDWFILENDDYKSKDKAKRYVIMITPEASFSNVLIESYKTIEEATRFILNQKHSHIEKVNDFEFDTTNENEDYVRYNIVEITI